MMRQYLLCAVAIACLSSATAVAATAEATSWGKPGVTIDAYHNDAITCGRAGYYADVSNTDAAHVFKDATGQLEANEADLSATNINMSPTGGDPMKDPQVYAHVIGITQRSARIVEGTRPAERMKDVAVLMQSKIDDCLKGRGYIRFRLTDQQRNHLARLHLGSPARHAYLYDLATDPDVLRAQAM